MSSAKLKANNEWLIWARETAYYDVQEIASKMDVDEGTIEQWENTGNIRYVDLLKLAEYYQRPPTIFFNATKPEYMEPIPDLRTAQSIKKYGRTPEFSFEVRSAIVRRQNLLKLEEESDDYQIPPFALKNIDTKNPTEISQIIIDKTRMNRYYRDRGDLNYWIKKVEELGVLVFQFYNIEPKEIRGYALYYDKLPIIGINHREYNNGKKFTLFHELAHLIIKKEGFSNFNNYYLKADEKFCNEIAAQTLVPNSMLKVRINDKNYSYEWDDKKIKELSLFFKVSNEVIVRRLLELNYATKEDYNKQKEKWNNFIAKKQRTDNKRRKTKEIKEQPKKEPDPDREYRRKASISLKQNGMYYTKSILDAYEDKIISIDEVANDLGVSIEVIREIQKRLTPGGSID